jgi:hypothetical protein
MGFKKKKITQGVRIIFNNTNLFNKGLPAAKNAPQSPLHYQTL